MLLEVFDIVGFIQDHIVPALTPENFLILDYQFVGGNTDMEEISFAPSLD